MNPGICYVYEYDNNQRKRNAGFLKIVRHYQSCILQIHVRGLPLGNGTTLELCAFSPYPNPIFQSIARSLRSTAF